MVRSVRKILPDAAILVIDDCSTDGTRKDALAAGAAVVSHVVNLGYGAALVTGYLYAIKGDFQIVLQMDGDGQHLAQEIIKLLDPVLTGEADLTLGSRYLEGCGYTTSLLKRLGTRLFSLVFSLATGTRLSDPTSGFQCLGKKALTLYTKAQFPADYPDVDVLLMSHYAGIKITERSVRMEERGGGASIHSGLGPFYYLIKMCLSILMVLLGYRQWRKHVS